MWDEIKKMKPIERRPDGELFRLTPKQARRVWRLVKLCCNNVDGDCLLLDDAKAVPVRSPLPIRSSANTFAAQSFRQSRSWKKTSSIRKICADAKSAALALSPVRDAPNTVLTVPRKCIANRRQPTPEKRDRA